MISSGNFYTRFHPSMRVLSILNVGSILILFIASPAWARIPDDRAASASFDTQDDPVLDQVVYLPLVKRSPSGWSSQTSGVSNALFGVGCAPGGQECQAAGRT